LNDYTSFKGVSSFDQSLITDELVGGLVDWFDWCFLGIGGFFNVYIPTSGNYGGSQHVLRLTDDPYFSGGQTWEGFRGNWVYETGISYSYQPIQISGIYVNNSFQPLGNSYYINYPLGRVVFNNPIASNSTVSLEYSYKFFNVYRGDAQWFRQLMTDSFRLDSPDFFQYGSGVWSVLRQERVELPALIVDAVPRRRISPYQLGGGSWVHQDLHFYILAETSFDRNFLVDVVTLQQEKAINLLDRNGMNSANAFPLDYKGVPQSGFLTYPALMNQYGGHYMRFENMISQDIESIAPGLYMAVVRATPCVLLSEI